jgi:hypothetical protein
VVADVARAIAVAVAVAINIAIAALLLSGGGCCHTSSVLFAAIFLVCDS